MLERGGVNGRELSSMQRLDHLVWHGTLIEQLDIEQLGTLIEQ
jgi:hypothetical protein